MWAGTAQAQAPVAQWRFDEGSGAITHDSSGSGLDATVAGGADGADPVWVDGVSGSALHFDGDDAVAVPRSTTLEPARISVAASVRRAGSPGAYRYILSKGASACSMSSYALYTGPRGSVAFYVSSGGRFTLSDQPAPSVVWDGRWHRLVGTYDGQDVRLYLDGRQVGGDVAEPGGIDYDLSRRALYIGAYRGGCNLSFSGDIDTVEIFPAALSGADIAGAPADSVPPPVPGTGGGPLPQSTSPAGPSAPVPATARQAACVSLQARPGSVRAGRRTLVAVTARVQGRPRAHVRIRLRGHKLRATAQTDRDGRARLRVRVPRAIRKLTVRARATKALGCAGSAVVTIPVRR
jgi:hypothetical protein